MKYLASKTRKQLWFLKWDCSFVVLSLLSQGRLYIKEYSDDDEEEGDGNAFTGSDKYSDANRTV